jgi:PKD repeat protein
LFVYSPTEPRAAQTVFFNASQSTPGPGRRIVSYRWNFGDGGTASGSTTTHTYAQEGTYSVVLRVTDDVGQVGTLSKEVTVCPLAGCDD